MKKIQSIRRLIIIVLFISESVVGNTKIDSLFISMNTKNDSLLCASIKSLHSYYAAIAPDSALMVAKKGLSVAKKRENQKFIADMHIRLAATYINISDFPKAQYHLTEAIKIAEMIEYNKAIPVIYNNIAIVYASNKDYVKAIEFYSLAIKADSTIQDWIGLGIDLTNLSEIYMYDNNSLQAIENYQKALSIYRQHDVPQLMTPALNNLGEAYLNIEQYDSALYYLFQAVELKTTLEQYVRIPASYTLIGMTYLKQSEYKKAYEYLIAAYEKACSFGLLRDAYFACEGLITYYESVNDYQNALNYSKLYKELADSIFSSEKDKQINELEIKYQVEKKNLEIDNLNTEIKYQRKFKNLGIILILLLLILFISLYKRIQQRNQLLKKDHELEKERSKQLKYELETKNRELVSKSMLSIQKNQTLNELKEQLLTTKDKNKENQLVINLINENYNLEKDWETLKIHFEEVHAGFFQKLQNSFPNLTANDMRHCAYMRIQMSSKDVSRIMNIDPKSVKMTRYRLKKKMNLDHETSLESYLNEF